MMKLYWAPHSRAFLGMWVLEEAGVPYERVRLDLRAGEQGGPDYRAINPMMKVPALVDGGEIITESGAICAYVADRAPAAGLAPPVGDARWGRYLSWLFFAGNCIEPAYAQKAFGLEGPSSSLAWGSFERVIDVLDEALQAGGPWILGERFTAADVMLAGCLQYGVDLFKIVESRPSFRAYIDRATARPAYMRTDAADAAAAAQPSAG